MFRVDNHSLFIYLKRLVDTGWPGAGADCRVNLCALGWLIVSCNAIQHMLNSFEFKSFVARMWGTLFLVSCPYTMLCRQLHMFLLSLLADKCLWPWVDGSINRSVCMAFFTRENKIRNFNIVHLIQHQVEASSSLSKPTCFAMLLHKRRSRFTFGDRMPIVSNTSEVFCFAGRGTPQLGYPVL